MNIYCEKDPIVNKTVIRNLKLPTKEEYDHAMCESGTDLKNVTKTLTLVLDAISWHKPNIKTAILENETLKNSIIYEQVINTLIADRRKTVRNRAADYYCRHHN